MRFQYGPLAVAMKYGHVLVLNEVDLADAGELAGLNDTLEGRPLVLAENAGEIIHPHPMFRVICTANSSGAGDNSGRYVGVQQQNLAFLHGPLPLSGSPRYDHRGRSDQKYVAAGAELRKL